MAARTDSSSSTIVMGDCRLRLPSFFPICFTRELFFTEEEVSRCAGRNLLYVGISGLILCGRDSQFFRHSDQAS